MPNPNFFSTNDHFDVQHQVYEYLTSKELFETLKTLNKNQYCLAALVLFSRLEREDIMYQQAMMGGDKLLPLFQAQANMAGSGGSLVGMLERRLKISMHSKYSDAIHKTQVMMFIDRLHNRQHDLSDSCLANLCATITYSGFELARKDLKRKRIDALNSLAFFADQLQPSQLNKDLFLALASAMTAPDEHGAFKKPGPTSVSMAALKVSDDLSLKVSPDVLHEIYPEVAVALQDDKLSQGKIHQIFAKLYVIRTALSEEECADILLQITNQWLCNVEVSMGRHLVIDVMKYAYLTYEALRDAYVQDLHDILRSQELTQEQKSKLRMFACTSSVLPQEEIVRSINIALECMNDVTLSRAQREVSMEVLSLLAPYVDDEQHMKQIIDAIYPHYLTVSWSFYCYCNEVFLLFAAKIDTNTRDKIIDVLISPTKPSIKPTQQTEPIFRRDESQEHRILQTLTEVVNEEQATKIILRYGTRYPEPTSNAYGPVNTYSIYDPEYDVAELYLDQVSDGVIARLLKDYIEPGNFPFFDEYVGRAASFLLHMSQRLNPEQRTALCNTFLQRGFNSGRDIYQKSMDTLLQLLEQPQSFDLTRLCDKAIDDYCATNSDSVEKKSSAVAFLVRFSHLLNDEQISKLVLAMNQWMDSTLQHQDRALEHEHLATLLPAIINQLQEHEIEQFIHKLTDMLSDNNPDKVSLAKNTLSACNDVLTDTAKEAVLSAVLTNIAQLSNNPIIMGEGEWLQLSWPQRKLYSLLDYLVYLNKTSAPSQTMIELNHRLVSRFIAHPNFRIYDAATKVLCEWLPNMSPPVVTSSFEMLLGMLLVENDSMYTKLDIINSLMKWTIATQNTERLQQPLEFLVQTLTARFEVNVGILNVTTDIQIKALEFIQAALEIATETQQDLIFQGLFVALNHQKANVRQSALDVLQPWLARAYQDEALVLKLQEEIEKLPDENLETTLLTLAIERMPGYVATHGQGQAPNV